MELIGAQMQRVWKLPAVVNFSCGGIGTGFYLVGLLLAPAPGGNWLQSLLVSAPFKLLGPALVGFGFLALSTEAGRPMRGFNLFRHLRRSWMSRETLAAAIFLPAAGLDWMFPNPGLRAIAAVAALALMLCQGFIVYRARGVTAWNTPLMPLLFTTSGLASGTGLALIVVPLFVGFSSQIVYAELPLAFVGLVTAGLNASVWLVYSNLPGDAFRKATAVLHRGDRLALVIGVGHVLPMLLLAAGTLASPSGPSGIFLVVCGAALVLGGVSQKFGIIMEAGYLRAINLEMPARRLTAERAKNVEILRV